MVYITFNSNSIVAVTMEDEPIILVPNTRARGIKILYYMGIALILIGASAVIIIKKKK